MKTSFDIAADLWRRLRTIESELNGGEVCQFHQPKNSPKWNVVINLLGASNEPMQYALANVNIHGPNLTGTNDNTQPDLARFATLTTLVEGLLDCHWDVDYHTDINTHGTPRQDTDGSWYANIRVNYYSVQTNKNI